MINLCQKTQKMVVVGGGVGVGEGGEIEKTSKGIYLTKEKL